MAAYRKAVTTKTFGMEHLKELDINFVQEMKFDPESACESKRKKRKGKKSVATEYLPFLKEIDHGYKIVSSKENKTTYNGIFYRGDKFKESSDDSISRAFYLMNLKHRIYNNIYSRGEEKIEQANRGKCAVL